MSALAAKGSDTTKKILVKHGVQEPFFGVKIADLKPLHKQLKGEQALALQLYATGNADAQYLAGMIADGAKMTPALLTIWAETANWNMISGFTVAWVASEHPDGFALATTWIDSKQEALAVAGWKTLAALATTVPDETLQMRKFSELLDRVAKTISAAPDEVRLAMNSLLIAVGTYVAPLCERAIATARQIGRVEADMGDTACKIPEAELCILKSRRGMAIAPKRKTVRC